MHMSLSKLQELVMDRKTWHAAVHGLAKRWTRLSDWLNWRARRSSQSILKEINPEYSLEGLMLKLKRHYFGHLMWRADSLGKSLMLGKLREGGWQKMRWLNGFTDSGHELTVACCSLWGCEESDTTEWLNWTDVCLRYDKNLLLKRLNMQISTCGRTCASTMRNH